MPASSPSTALHHAGGAPACQSCPPLKRICAATNTIPASVHAHHGTILISAANPVGASSFTCIVVPTFSSPLLFSVVGQMSAASQEQRTHDQRRRDPEERKTRLPNPARNACPFAHPFKQPPQKGDGQRRSKAHAQTSQPHQPHAFPRLPKPAGVEAHPHLRGSHQAGIGGERQRTQSKNHPVCCFRIMTARFAFIQMGPQPGLPCIRGTFAQSDQLPCFVMCVSRHVCVPSNRPISMFSPRYNRYFSVPRGAPITAAISSKANPSWKRNTIASRYSAGMPTNAALMRSACSCCCTTSHA